METNQEAGYKTQYFKLFDRYREEVIDRHEAEARLLYQLRSQMITTVQLEKELEIARETIDALLYRKVKEVDVLQLTH